MNFPAPVHAFRQTTCRNWLKNGQNSLIVWEVCEIVWKDHQEVFRLMYMLLDTQNIEIEPKLAKIALSVWKMCEECVSVWRSVWKCMKVSLISFPAQVLAFRHPACLHLLKNCQYSPKCMKSAWRVCEEMCENVWNFQNLWDGVPGAYLPSFTVLASILRDFQLSEGVMDRVREWVNEWVRWPRCRDGHLARGQGPS